MGKVDRKDYRSPSDMVSPDDIEETAILTISEFQDGDRKDKEGKWALLKFEELENKILFLTDGAFAAIIEHYGDDSDDWKGKSLPVEQYKKKGGEMAVRVMAAEEWESLFKEAGMKYPGKSARPAPRAASRAPTTTGKRGVKRGNGRRK